MSERVSGRPPKDPEMEKSEAEEEQKRSRGRPKRYPEREILTVKEEDPETVKGTGRPRRILPSAKISHSHVKAEGSEHTTDSALPAAADEPVVVISSPLDPQKERGRLRNMFELASVLNFIHVFRPVLNINMEFSAEELETALITPNNTLSQLHIQLLKGIPPVSRTLGNNMWVTALCKKLADWWPWVAEGELPLVACHGEEIIAYKKLDPCTRVLVLKALCEIRLEQDDIWKFIDDSLKHNNFQLSSFRKARLGGDAHGTSYWYDADSIIGHRLYREIQKIEVKIKPKGKGRSTEPLISCQWETIATNLDEFLAVSEKFASSRNKVEAGIGKKIKNDIVPVLEELQKKKERALKKQQRQATLLDSFFVVQGETIGRSRRDRKPVKYTFDDYDRSIDEAIQMTKKIWPSSDNFLKKHMTMDEHPEANGNENGHGNSPENRFSPESKDGSEESNVLRTSGPSTRSTRLRPTAQRSMERKYMEDVSDNDVDSKNEMSVEAVTDGGIKSKKSISIPSSSDGEDGSRDDADGDDEYREDDGDEEYREDDGDEEYREDEEDAEDDDDNIDDESIKDDISDSPHRRKRSCRRKRSWRSADIEDVSISDDDDDEDDDDDSGDKRKYPTRGKRRGKPVVEHQSGLRRSKRATRVDYSKYEMSNSEEENLESQRQSRPNVKKKMSKMESDVSNSSHSDMKVESSLDNDSDQARDEKQLNTEEAQSREAFAEEPILRSWAQFGEQSKDLKSRHFIDLNEAAPLTGFDDVVSNNSTKQIVPEDSISKQVLNNENDDHY